MVDISVEKLNSEFEDEGKATFVGSEVPSVWMRCRVLLAKVTTVIVGKVVVAVTADGDDEAPLKPSLGIIDDDVASNEVTPVCDSSPNIATPSVVK